MPPRIAFFAYAGYIAWVFAQDRKRRAEVSRALWIPLLWILIIGSRPLSLWLGLGVTMESSEDYAEGSPFDRIIFLGLIVAGVRVLVQRNFNFAEAFGKNKALFLFYLFWLLSVVWSDYPMVSFKRWVKDLGNVVMVFVVLSEKDPVASLKWLFARWCYILLPMSVLFIKYFPELGRMVNSWTWEFSYVGVTTDKNSLGPIVFVSWVFLLWDMFERPPMERKESLKWKFGIYLPLSLMIGWLLYKANSQTSWAAVVLATILFLFMRTSIYRTNVRSLEMVAGAVLIFVLFLDPILEVKASLLGLMGRDSNLTGRTDIWKMAWEADINPLLGVGFYTFWMGEQADRITAIYRGINQAHNGFLETYLNGGMIAVGLLLWVLIAGYGNIRRELVERRTYDNIRCILWFCVVLYNMTEALFNRLSPLWFILIFVCLKPWRAAALPEAASATTETNSSAPPSPQWQGGLGGFMPVEDHPVRDETARR